MGSHTMKSVEQMAPDGAGRRAAPAAAIAYALGWLVVVCGLVWLGASAVKLGMPTLPLLACAVTILVGLAVIAFAQHRRGRLAGPGAAAEAQEPEREDRDRALESERRRFQALSESSQDLITELDLEGRLLYASPNHGEVLGWGPEELVGRDWRKVIHAEDLSYADASQNWRPQAGEIPPTAYRVRHRDGSVRWLESAGRVFTAADGNTRLLAITRDVTRRVALETQLRQSQKLEAVGRLAGGVAHDFNNLLTVINGYSEILRDDERFSDDPALSEILAAGERAQSLTRQLLAFSRRRAQRPRILDLDQAVSGVEGLLLRLLGEQVSLSFRASPEPLQVFLDPSELEQVVVNLAVNARDAMPKGGRIEIASRAEERAGGGEGRASWAVLEVRDEGVGMSGEVLSHLFEPFYTTKEVGQGTGLGLATVHGIVEQSGGHVDVDSEPGAGTCFRIYLRRVDAMATQERAAPPVTEPRSEGAATILLAEDDASVRRLVRSILAEGGYRVIETEDGIEALSILQRREQPIDLLLTDVVMPAMGGRALRAQLSELRPGTPAVFMSGYPDRNRDQATLTPRPGDSVIGKPFTRGELLSTLHAVLDGEARRRSEALPQEA